MNGIRALLRSVIVRSVLLNAISYALVVAVVRIVRSALNPDLTWQQALNVIVAAFTYGMAIGVVSGGIAFLILQRGPGQLRRARIVSVVIEAVAMFIFVPVWTNATSAMVWVVATMLSVSVAAITWVLSRWTLGTADAPRTERSLRR